MPESNLHGVIMPDLEYNLLFVMFEMVHFVCHKMYYYVRSEQLENRTVVLQSNALLKI